MCANPNPNLFWVLQAEQAVIDMVFSCMWEFTYSMRTFIYLVESGSIYTVVEEREIYLQLNREGLLDNW